jgi:hypothetical protein
MMKKILFLCAFVGIIGCSDDSNDPEQVVEKIFQGNVVLTTMTEVLEFSQNNYTDISGRLFIGEAANTIDPITSLSSLSTLRTASSITIVDQSVLTNLNGLQNIETTENIDISFNSEITDISAFDGVSVLGFTIADNPKLRKVDNFRIASEEMFFIGVFDNPLLENLECFANVTDLRRSLRIVGNDGLTNLTGLDNILSIGSQDFFGQAICQINENNRLQSLEGFNAQELFGNVEILLNPVLSNIDNFSTVNFMLRGDLAIAYNAISNIDGLGGLRSVNGNISIIDNPNLSDFCGIKILLLLEGQTNGLLYIFGNLANPSEQDIVDNTSCN